MNNNNNKGMFENIKIKIEIEKNTNNKFSLAPGLKFRISGVGFPRMKREERERESERWRCEYENCCMVLLRQKLIGIVCILYTVCIMYTV